MRVFTVAGWRVGVDESLARLAEERCGLAPFSADPCVGQVQVRLERTFEAPRSSPLPLAPGHPPVELFVSSENVLSARLADDPVAAESALRALFHVLVLRGGGIVLHAAGLSFSDRAIVAFGPSGAGKSTLSRLCVEAGRAHLLSDELIGVHPDGSVEGSPFRSAQDLVADTPSGRLRGLISLRKGAFESVEVLSPSEAVPLLLSQTTRLMESDLPRGELLRRVTAVCQAVGTHRLTFRKAPEVASFLEEWVRGAPAAGRRAGALS